MERYFAAYLFTLFCPLFTSGASFSIAHEYSARKVNWVALSFGLNRVLNFTLTAKLNLDPESGFKPTTRLALV